MNKFWLKLWNILPKWTFFSFCQASQCIKLALNQRPQRTLHATSRKVNLQTILKIINQPKWQYVEAIVGILVKIFLSTLTYKWNIFKRSPKTAPNHLPILLYVLALPISLFLFYQSSFRNVHSSMIMENSLETSTRPHTKPHNRHAWKAY